MGRFRNTRSGRARARCLLIAVAVLTGALGGIVELGDSAAPAGAVTVPPEFVAESVLGGLVAPTAIRFAPDGRVFVAEKRGVVKVFPNMDATSGTTLLNLSAQVMDWWDRGLLGLAVDPRLTTGRPYVYVAYSRDEAPMSPGVVPRWNDACSWNLDGCPIVQRLSRFSVSGNGTGSTIVPGSELVLITAWCAQFPSHAIGEIDIASDGSLYMAAGDGASFDTVDYGQHGGSQEGSPTPRNPCGDPPGGVGGAMSPPSAQGGALRSQSVRRTGAATLDGTIIRINADTGGAAPGNPFGGDSDPNRARVVAYGLRNPYRWTLRPGSNDLWIGDVGWNNWEMVDVAPAGTAPNFGWPCYEGPAPMASYQAAGLSQCTNLYAEGSRTTPYYSYRHGQRLYTGDPCPTGNGSSVTGLAFAPTAGPGLFPAAYRGALFLADYSRSCIYAMSVGTNGLPDPATVHAFATGIQPVDLTFGPDGHLYAVDLDADTVIRMRNRVPNSPPTASITAAPTTGPVPLAVDLDGSASSDPDGDPLTYAWDLDGDGNYDDASGPTAHWTYTSAAPVMAGLRVSDPGGASDTASVWIDAGNTPPVALLSVPQAASLWRVDDLITFSGSAIDDQEGAVPTSQLSWEVRLHHCTAAGGCHAHPLQTLDGVAGGSFLAPDHEHPSHLEIRLTARDGTGLANTTSSMLYPQTTTLEFGTVPHGAGLAVGSEVTTAPFARTAIVGARTTLTAPAVYTESGTDYVFESWSDGGTRSHELIAPGAPARTVARFRAADRTAGGTFAGWDYEDLDPAGGTDPIAVSYAGQPHVFAVADGVLTHSWYDGVWRRDQPAGQATGGDLAAFAYNGGLHVMLRDDAQQLRQVWWDGRAWQNRILDAHPIGDGISTVIFDGLPHVFYQRNGRLWHTWWNGHQWLQDNPAGATGGRRSSAVVYRGGPHVFFENAGGGLQQAWWDGRWNQRALDGSGGTDTSALLYGGTPHVFSRGSGGRLRHTWWTGLRWAIETLDAAGDVSGVRVARYRGLPHVYYRTGAGALGHAFWTGTRWYRELLDGPGSAGRGRTVRPIKAATAPLEIYGQAHVWYQDAVSGRLSHGWY